MESALWFIAGIIIFFLVRIDVLPLIIALPLALLVGIQIAKNPGKKK